jgi:hypothetical protein
MQIELFEKAKKINTERFKLEKFIGDLGFGGTSTEFSAMIPSYDPIKILNQYPDLKEKLIEGLNERLALIKEQFNSL